MGKISLGSETFTRGVEDIITRSELEGLLKRGRPLRVKHGIDLTAPGLHLGHAASLWKLRELQEAGHKAVVLLGDTTTQIGDPSGKTKARPLLSREEISRNFLSIAKSIKRILLTSPERLEIRRNSEWYKKTALPELLKILSMVTHARLIERDMFRNRIKKGEEIYAHEFLYPVLQGYDSVMLKSDLTIIGSDQLFNEHLGRFLQEKFGQSPQVIVTLKILPGIDGGEKMSKSTGNYIGLDDSPRDKFGKAMRVLDRLVIPYLEHYTDVPLKEVKRWEGKLRNGINPMEVKLFWAESLVRRYHGKSAGTKEKEYFLKAFSRREKTDFTPAHFPHGRYPATELLLRLGAARSKSEARRLMKQRGVEINGEVFADPGGTVLAEKNTLVRVGRRAFKIK